MKRDTPEILRALDIACHSTTWLSRLSGEVTTDERYEALHTLRHEHGFRAAPPLLRHLFDLRWHERPGVDDFATTIDHMLRPIQPEHAAWLDRELRVWHWHYPGQGFDALTPDSLERWARRLVPHVRVLGLVACHRSGFVREAALGWIAARLRSHVTEVESALPLLALRVNDHVPQVAARATVILRGLLVPAHRAAIYGALAHLVRMVAGHRKDQHDLGDRLRAIIADDRADAMPSAFTSLGDAPGRFVLETLNARPERVWAVARAILRHRASTPLQLFALRRLAETSPPSEQRELRETLATLAVRGKSDAVRQDAMTRLAALAPDDARERVTTWLFDRSTMSRLVARDLGRTLHAARGATRDAAFDARAVYRVAIAAPDTTARRLAIAVSGLGEMMAATLAATGAPTVAPASSSTGVAHAATGARVDAEADTGANASADVNVNAAAAADTSVDTARLAALATHPAPRVRIAVLLALSRVAPDRAAPFAIAGLTADASRVRAAALRALRAQIDHIDLDEIRARLATADPAPRVAVLGLLQAAPKWDALIFLLEALADTDEGVRREALRRIALWLQHSNHSQRRATRAQLARIGSLLETFGERLSRETLAELQFAARGAASTLT